MANITEAQLLHVINEKQVDAETNRSRILKENQFLEDRYNAEYYGTEVPGRSSFVSNDVKDAVEAAHTSLTTIFLGAGPIITFTASNPEDKAQQAEAEEKTKFIDFLIRGQTNSYKTQSSFLTEVLKLKAGVLKYFYEETESTEDFNWDGLTILEVADQLQSMGFELGFVAEDEVELISSAKTKEGKVISHNENEDGTFDIKVRVKTKRQIIKVVTVPAGSFLLSSGADDLEDAELVGDDSFKKRGELLEEGHSRELVAKLPAASINGNTQRTIEINTFGAIEESDFSEWASQRVPISDLYVMVDYNNDGIAERRHIQRSGDFILHNEAFDHVPYATGSALIVPNSVIGEGWGEQVTDIAEVNTAITRGVLDNIYSVNNTKKAVRVGRNGVNIDEALSPIIGGIVQVSGERPLNDMVMPLVTEFIGDKALLVKQHMDQMKAQRVGNQLTSQGLDGDALSKETATRFNGIEKTDKAKIIKIARNIAEVAYRKLYEGAAWIAAHNQMDEVEFAVLGKALKANPANWKYDDNVSTDIGLGGSDDDKIAQNMQGAWAIHNQLKQAGSSLTDDKKGYNILSKMYKAIGVKDVSQMLNDPEEPAELLRHQNEILNATALQQQELIQQLQQAADNPLAEAEMVKREGDIAIAQGKLELGVETLKEDRRQFDIDASQKTIERNEKTAIELTKIEVQSGQNIPGSVV